LSPHGFGLRFNAVFGVENGDRAIEDTKRAFDFNGEVDVPRGVDDVDTVALPEASGRGGGDGDATFLFLAIQSMTAVPSWTSPILWVRPV
jgi:hypothetical protein